MNEPNNTPLWAKLLRGAQYAGMIVLLVAVFIANGTEYQNLVSFVCVLCVFAASAINSFIYAGLIQKHCTKPVWLVPLLWTALSVGIIAYGVIALDLWQNLTYSAVLCLLCLLGYGGVEYIVNNLCIKFPNK